MRKELTERQLEILKFIKDFRASRGMAPTLREIAQRFNFSSLNSASQHIRLLRQKGALEPAPEGVRRARAFIPT